MSPPRAETIYLNTPNAVVTNARAVLHGVTYSMANVTSVRTHEIAPNAMLPIATLLLGVVVIVVGIVNQKFDVGFIGAIIAVLGGWLVWRMKCTYVLFIGSAGGEQHAMASHDRNEIKTIESAITNSIIYRG